MQTPSSPQSLWKGIYKKREKQSQKFGIELNKQIVEEHIIVLVHLYKVQNLVKQSYFRNIYMFSNIRKKNIDDCKIQDGGVPWGCRIKVDMIEYGVIQRISEVLVQFCFFFNGLWTQGIPFIVIYFFNKHLLSTYGRPSTTHSAGNRAGNKENKNPNLHGTYMLVNFPQVTVLQLENYQLRLCPKYLASTKTVTKTLPASQEFQERQAALTLKTLTVSE